MVKCTLLLCYDHQPAKDSDYQITGNISQIDQHSCAETFAVFKPQTVPLLLPESK